MKKMIFAAALLAGAAFGVNAQENVNLPESGDFAVEVQFNPFTDNFETFGLDGMKLQGRYFFSNADALRVGLGFGVNTNKVTPDPDGEGLEKDANDFYRKGNFAIDLGYERHFLQKGRVDLYAGAGVGFALQSSKKTHKYVDVEGDTSVLRETKSCNYNGNDGDGNSYKSYNEFNVNVFTGIDFYVYRGLYVGAELGLKVGFKNFPSSYTQGGVNDKTGKWDDKYESEKGAKKTALDLATYVQPALRLGWTF